MNHPDHTSERDMLKLSNPSGLYDPTPNGYSHVASVRADARFVFVAGQGGEDQAGELSPDFRTQVRKAFFNLETALQSSGAEMRNIAKLTVLIVNHTEERLAILGEELSRASGEPTKPTCTLIPVPRLALDGMLFEVEAVAVL